MCSNNACVWCQQDRLKCIILSQASSRPQRPLLYILHVHVKFSTALLPQQPDLTQTLEALEGSCIRPSTPVEGLGKPGSFQTLPLGPMRGLDIGLA
jgi:hypothetical protein